MPASSPIGVASLEVASPKGTNGSPHDTLVTSRSGAASARTPHRRGGRAEHDDERSRSGQPPPAGHDDGTGQHQAEHRVEPEDRAPLRDDEHQGAQHRAEDRAELLHRPHDAERHPAPVGGPQLGDDRQRRGDQAAAAHALHHPARDEDRQLDGERGDDRARHEDAEAGEQHAPAVDEVGDTADERQDGDVAEEEAGDDGRGPLEGVDAHADPAHHVGEGEDDDVGVGGRQRDGDRRGRQQRPRGG